MNALKVPRFFTTTPQNPNPNPPKMLSFFPLCADPSPNFPPAGRPASELPLEKNPKNFYTFVFLLLLLLWNTAFNTMGVCVCA